MRLLHEEELSVILSLSEKQEEDVEIVISDELRSYLDEWRLLLYFKELSDSGLIKIESVKIDYTRGGFMDAFMNSYSKLVTKQKTEEAKKLADNSGFKTLNKTLKSVKTIEEIDNQIEDILKDHSILRGSDFEKDLIWNILIKFKKTKKFSEYINAYIEAFKNDELVKPVDPKPNDEWSSFPEYFKRDFYRYKKQRQILIDLIRKKLDTQNPKKITILIEELPISHLNDSELLLALENEGLINNSEFIDGLGSSNHWLLSVDEGKIQNEPSNKEVKLNLSFQPKGEMILEDQQGNKFIVKIQGQVQKEVLRVIFQNPQNTYEEWSLYDISNMVGAGDADTKAVKNALYQFNKKVKLKIPEVENLFDFNIHTAKLNSKYLNR